MLIPGFYTVNHIAGSDSQLIAQITIDKNHEIYTGHFPDLPVTPGVVQLQIVSELLALHFSKKYALKKIGRCKFLAVLDPFVCPSIEVKVDVTQVEGELQIAASGYHEQTTFFKFSGVYQ